MNENVEETLIYQKPAMKELEMKLVYHGNDPAPAGSPVVDPDDNPGFFGDDD